MQGYYYSISLLTDFLTKRELLYRQYLEINNKVLSIPLDLSATPTNPLLTDLRYSFTFSDPVNFSSEYSRELLYSSLEYFKVSLLYFIKNQALSTYRPFEFLFSLPFYENIEFSDFLKDDSIEELYKNQHRPLRKGVSSMLRLHATGAIALPIDLRLQILASSRDVIHS